MVGDVGLEEGLDGRAVCETETTKRQIGEVSASLESEKRDGNETNRKVEVDSGRMVVGRGSKEEVVCKSKTTKRCE